MSVASSNTSNDMVPEAPYKSLLKHVDVHLLPLLKIPFTAVISGLKKFCKGDNIDSKLDDYKERIFYQT